MSCRILFAAPRILNAPIGCRLSALSQISLPVPWPDTPGNAARTSGVLIAMRRNAQRGARMASSLTSCDRQYSAHLSSQSSICLLVGQRVDRIFARSHPGGIKRAEIEPTKAIRRPVAEPLGADLESAVWEKSAASQARTP